MEVKIRVHDVQWKSWDMASSSSSMKDTANVVKGQKEAIHHTVTEVKIKVKMGMGSMDPQAEQSLTNVDPAKTKLAQIDLGMQVDISTSLIAFKFAPKSHKWVYPSELAI